MGIGGINLQILNLKSSDIIDLVSWEFKTDFSSNCIIAERQPLRIFKTSIFISEF